MRMRIGKNPNRHAIRAGQLPHEKPTVLIVVHLPNFDGYHKERFRIVQACVKTARECAGADHNLLLWDNGSHEQVAAWLQQQADLYIRSQNMGKTSATKYVCKMLGMDAIIARSDDDVLFYDGWLAESIKVLSAFPAPCEVSASPSMINMTVCNSTIKWGRDHNCIRTEKFPESWDYEHGRSLGYDNAKTDEYRRGRSFLLRYNGVEAWAGCSHFQTTSRGEYFDRFTYHDNLMRDELQRDIDNDAAGALRLFTAKRYARHVGNVLSDGDKDEFEARRL